MAFVFSIKDSYRAAVEAVSGGKNTVLYDDKGNPSIMVVIPKFKLSDIDPTWPSDPHPAFIVNGVEKSEIFISKYQNIVVDGRAYSLPMQDPKVYVNFDQARSYCTAKGKGWHLMTNAEWAAIALWCKKNGFMPRGNNNFGSDISAPHEKGVQTYLDSGTQKTGRVATGSGPASWAHDNTNNGIFDLNGNVSEWVGGYRVKDGEIQILPNNDAADADNSQAADSTKWRAIMPDGSLVDPGTPGTLKWDYTADPGTVSAEKPFRLNTVLEFQQTVEAPYGSMAFHSLTAADGVTVPEILKALALFPADSGDHGSDRIYMRNIGERLAYRGGYWNSGSNAGVFYMYGSSSRSYAIADLSFRSAFVL